MSLLKQTFLATNKYKSYLANASAANVLMYKVCYPFGMTMPGRNANPGDYRYGFNGKEEDVEGMGGGKSTYDYGFRIYNPQIARFLSVDPLTASYPWYTPYQFAGNGPIWAIDLDGLEDYIVIQTQDESGFVIRISISTVVTVSDEKALQDLGMNPAGIDQKVLIYTKDASGRYIGIDHANDLNDEQNNVLSTGTLYKHKLNSEQAYQKDTGEEGKKFGKGYTMVNRSLEYSPPAIPISKPKSPRTGPVTPIPTSPPVSVPAPDLTPDYKVSNLNLNVDFDLDGTDFDAPGFHYGSDPLDDVLAPVVDVLRKNPKSYVEIKVSTSLNKGASHSTYGSTENLLKARKQAVIKEFNRIAPDLKPDQVRVNYDESSYNSNIGFKGTLNEVKDGSK